MVYSLVRRRTDHDLRGLKKLLTIAQLLVPCNLRHYFHTLHIKITLSKEQAIDYSRWAMLMKLDLVIL